MKKLLIVDGNQQHCDTLCAYMRSKDRLDVLEPVIDGRAAIDVIKAEEPDIIVMDLVLPQMDGYEIMRAIQGMQLSKKPDIVILTCLRRDDFIIRAISLGASYYVVKPFDYEVLYERITDMGEIYIQDARPAMPPTPTRSIDEKLANMFLVIGIPAHIKGYQYLREAVKLVVSNNDIINRITKELYPTIARKFNTSSSKVERAIRHAIEVAWNRGKIESINQVFGYTIYTADEKPTNGEFIALIADKLTLEQSA